MKAAPTPEAFHDPRGGAVAPDQVRSARKTTTLGDLAELHELCRAGRLYEVEEWIRSGRPLQLDAHSGPGRRKFVSALELALESGNHSLALLLLSNGIDPNIAPASPLDIALRVRRWDLVDLLLEWGADPHRVDLSEVFGSYRLDLYQRFWDLGVNLTEGHALAEFLIEHQGAKPAFGFAKRHRTDPRIQRELNVALAYHAGAGNEKGVALCLWAGADSHAPACTLRFGRRCVHTIPADEREDKDDEEPLWSPIDEAVRAGDVAILKRLKPDPALDDLDELYGWARDRYVIDYLMGIAPPIDPNRVLQHRLWRIGWFDDDWRAMDTLKALFEAGLRWTNPSKEAAAGMRHILLHLGDAAFMEVVALLAQGDHCAPEILREIGRTPAMQKRFKTLGYVGGENAETLRSSRARYRPRPTHVRQVVARFGVKPPKPKKPAPTAAAPSAATAPTTRSATIGRGHRGGTILELDRVALYERVWSLPVATLAADWGLSGPGLRKACHRLGVPVPPRGYWARLRAGQRPRRLRLPAAAPGAPATIRISVPAAGPPESVAD